MKSEKQQSGAAPAPKGAGLEKADVWLRVEVKRRLEEIAARENRSVNKQAVHYIEQGLAGLSPEQMAQRIDSIESKLDEVLRRLAEK
ncbi:MAG TPA: hypothetical protein VNS29_04095 [Burkholderiaceae bacterium]|nr:hypothetical protein [Burkholderiaceae bacterium]